MRQVVTSIKVACWWMWLTPSNHTSRFCCAEPSKGKIDEDKTGRAVTVAGVHGNVCNKTVKFCNVTALEDKILRQA